MQEKRVARFDELKNGEMKEVKVGDTDVLLARIADEYYALYAKCTHYGGPLAEGALNEERCQVVCPWHHAHFDVRTGQHLEAPGIDGLPTYGVRVDGDDVYVTISDPESDRRTNQMVAYHPSDQRNFLIIGGGAAAAYAAEGLREAGFTGRIEVITREEELPYDRPNCSKEYLADEAPEEWMPLRDKGFYGDNGIVFRSGSEVVRLDANEHLVELKGGEHLKYDKVLICTGGIPRRLNVPGADAENVHYLRSLKDSRQLRDAAKGAETAVVIGSSFIGLESAMSLQKLGLKVQVVGTESIPFSAVFGKEVGKAIEKMHLEAGISFHLGARVKRLDTEDGKVTSVVLEDDSVLVADLVLIGIGVQPATDYIQGLSKEEDGGLRVNAFLEAAADVYVAGDIAHFTYQNQLVRIEHWKNACQMGRIAGFNMAGEQIPFTASPFFWTAQQDWKLRYLGHAEDFDEVHIDGSLADGNFIAYYRKNGKDLAVLACGRDREMAELDASGNF
jgi:NADPH-dependent 2,4-dienoyl-CoA reductase/sulfur reductase-like enzyme/nitrite reductase/ring-hydroxylating ferredoxin subunit